MTYILAAWLVRLPVLTADHPRSISRIAVAHDLARLTASQAELLEGKRAKYWIVLDSLPDYHEGYVLYDCLSRDEIGRTVWFEGEQNLAEDMVVEATLRVLHHVASVARNGTPFQGFTEYRLTHAIRRW
jgi:hypothetical protein